MNEELKLNNNIYPVGVVKKPFEPVIKDEWFYLESGKLIKKFRRDSTATALKRMAYMEE